MMATAKFILTASVIIIATLWGAAQQANAIFTSPGSGSRGNFQRSATGDYGHRTTTQHWKHRHHH